MAKAARIDAESMGDFLSANYRVRMYVLELDKAVQPMEGKRLDEVAAFGVVHDPTEVGRSVALTRSKSYPSMRCPSP